ncbi:anti-sigma factor antagonist [Streptomyces sp. GXMU-J15]|uniref:Anti-sigma factor antagonist n=1 Tax=Streptomyces fuscus TaxID=3048495 RepID=A0ABT7ITU1_9ACTN|nr:anti-sigma factor antagonist [Streptomyces fuscus]MDL2075993.1 anti-sigma factor antagonist [Streptomyces fuscus]SBT90164.1 anti-sigma B factor antagonist [Streptomyces sp. DI166]
MPDGASGRPRVSYEDRPDGVTLVRLAYEGEGDASALRGDMLRLVEDGRPQFVVDFGGLGHVDDPRALVEDLKWACFKGAAISLVVTSAAWHFALADAGLYRLCHAHDTLEDALKGRAAMVEEGSSEWARHSREADERHDASGGHTYEHLSEDVTLVRVMAGHPFGHLDVYAAPGLRALIVDLANQGRHFLVLDLTHLGSLDSTGLGVFVGALKRTRARGGSIAMVVPSARILKMFRITGLTKYFPVYDTVAPAVEHIGREVPGAHV